jgi:K+-dependent Na+/Ca+ exchanger-like protein
MLPLFDSMLNCQGKISRGGTFIHKHRVRAVFRSVSFFTLVVIICVFNSFMQYHGDENRRHLEDEDPESNRKGIFQIKADPYWLMGPYIFGVLYMFLGLAIVCDEYFVPALEAMSGEHHLNLTPDISGATLMAAGGSAPELFTSFIGTFQGSEVGFGTIVGSAVFNVLFVIGMCSLLSKDVLQLTWWPLFRDSTYYAIGLLVLAIFVGVVTPAVIEWWESFVLFMMYLGYIFIMSKNQELYTFFSGKKPNENVDDTVAATESFTRNITFRTGLLSMIRGQSWMDNVRVGFVAKISGDVDDVFDFVDENGDGKLSAEELKICLEKIEGNDDSATTEDDVNELMEHIDMNGNGKVSKSAFRTWYLKSEEHIKKQIRTVFETYDFNNSGGIYPLEFRTMLKEVEPNVQNSEIDIAVGECYKEGSGTELSFDAFCEWYLSSTWYMKHTKGVEEEIPTVCENICPPKNAGCFGFLKYIFLLPIVATLSLTVPDVRRPGAEKTSWCYFAFLVSIMWIGVYSYLMVGWAETIGETLGIDTFIMGLTFLAAGTSVPDLISSVIVARMGEGDMAVSSSIGSNIFDILVGLPIPWLAYALWPTMPKAVSIGADGVWLSIMILLGMLVLIVIAIHLSGWKLTKKLGFVMFFFYICFLGQAITRYILGL